MTGHFLVACPKVSDRSLSFTLGFDCIPLNPCLAGMLVPDDHVAGTLFCCPGPTRVKGDIKWLQHASITENVSTSGTWPDKGSVLGNIDPSSDFLEHRGVLHLACLLVVCLHCSPRLEKLGGFFLPRSSRYGVGLVISKQVRRQAMAS
jgi:hypothetical protein